MLERKNYLSAITMLTILCVAIGCTKKRPYDAVDADQTSLLKNEPKSLIDFDAKYLYVPSSLNSTRSTDATFPMYMGEAKVVKLQMEENRIRVVELDPEDEFAPNPINNKPVLSIPIDHVDTRCALDANGKCTNKEEVDEDKPWAQRRFVRFRPAEMAVQEINFLPVEITNLFYPCYEVVAKSAAFFKWEKDAINIGIERSYKSDIRCAGKLQNISDLTFKVLYTYSLVKLDSLRTPDYKPFQYRRAEETMFGFFDTRTLKLDSDLNETISSERVYLNRWSPNRVVDYYLTPNFNKPQHAKIKQATIAAVEIINSTLEKAGTPMRIRLKEASEDLNVGDLRVNSIAMVEEPVSYGILGYGPTAANPYTGEIVHGRTAMYLGVMKTGLQRAYQELVQERQNKKTKSQNLVQAGEVSESNSNLGVMELAPNLLQAQRNNASLSIAEFQKISNQLSPISQLSKTEPSEQSSSYDPHTDHLSVRGAQAKRLPVSGAAVLAKAQKRLSHRISLRDVQNLLVTNPSSNQLRKNRLVREYIESLHCFLPSDMGTIHAVIDQEIDAVLDEVGAKPWEELSSGQREKVVQTLLPFVWIPTLIHELGHNLGLRHNFAGSEDQSNFYTRVELDAMGVQRDFAYSSVMDYGYRSTNELQVMGKYDIAALRFAYAEKVELEDGQLMSVNFYRQAPQFHLKPYAFCTDEHADVNPNCNRFDEGTNLVEMAQHWMAMYEEAYQRRSLRHQLRDFSLYDDDVQIHRIGMIMDNLRSMFERYESIKQTYGLADNHPAWQQYEFLKELQKATQMAGQFFVQVLKTPDTLCAYAKKTKPNSIIGVVPIRYLSTDAISCYDRNNVDIEAVDSTLVIVGEAGKSFQSRKDPYNSNPYVDQIDVRGIWIDKLLALESLAGRFSGVELYDEFLGNYLDLESMRDQLQSDLGSLVLDEAVSRVPIRTLNGQVLVAQIGLRLYETNYAQNGHQIIKPLNGGVQQRFGIPDAGMSFQGYLVEYLKGVLPSREQNADPTSLMSSITAYNDLPQGNLSDDYISTVIGLNRYFVHVNSDLATQILIDREVVRNLSQLDEVRLVAIFNDLDQGKPPPANASEAEKFAYLVGKDVIQRFIDNGFQDQVYYETVLRTMAH